MAKHKSFKEKARLKIQTACMKALFGNNALLSKELDGLEKMSAGMNALFGEKGAMRTLRIFLKRPEWFYNNVKIPDYRIIEAPAVKGLADEDRHEIAQAIIDSFHAAISLDVDNEIAGRIWSGIIANYTKPLAEILKARDRKALVEYLDGMFQQSCLWGIASSTGWRPEIGDKHPFLTSYIVEDIVSLGEYLGVVRTEGPEQGHPGHALTEGMEKLIFDIEKALGFKIDFPHLFKSYGLMIDGRHITNESPEHIYASQRLMNNIHRYTGLESPRILEIGAGFGGTAYWYLKAAEASQYIVYDLAFTNIYQGWFLSNVFGRENIALFSDVLKEGGIGDKKVCVLPVNSDRFLRDGKVNCVFNQNSFPEMPAQVVGDYIRLAKDILHDGILFSYNHEASVHSQTLVNEKVAEVGGFERLSRDRSWVRRGYVEDVFRPV